MTRLIQLVPELAPDVGGVADYADRLAAALAPFGFDSTFVAPRKPPGRTRPLRPDLLEVDATPASLAAALRTLAADAGSRPTDLLLHYVGYGFDPRACPTWLVDGLDQALGAPDRERQPERFRLATLFHETWLGGPPWTHRFWLLPRQRALIGRLARRSRHCVTTTAAAAAGLRALVPAAAARLHVLPTPSTFGETAPADWPAQREPHLVVLGLPPVRRRVYRSAAIPAAPAGSEPALLRFCRQAGIEQLHDIGPPFPDQPRSLAGLPGLPDLPIHRHGVLAAPEVGRLLTTSRALAVAYPRHAAAKSTVVAAGMANGCPVFNCAEPLPPDDGLSLWRPATWDGADAPQAARDAHALYHERRSWQVVSSRLAELLRGFDSANLP